MVDIPKFDEFMTPLLEVLKKANGDILAHDATETVIENMKITEDQLSVINLSSGGSKVIDRVHWAASYLKKVDAIERPKRGYLRLGVNAEKLLSLRKKINLSDLKKMPEWAAYELKKKNLDKDKNVQDNLQDIEESTPQDLIESGVKTINDQLVEDLLDQINKLSPKGFESLVLNVLAKMGYGGGDASRIKGVPRGPDGGIDGKINEDKLGLDQIYIQAKKYSDQKVSRPTIQGFVGAMTGGGCKKGVFVTSSEFTSEAIRFSEDLRDQRLILINGTKLANLMIEFCVGVQVKETIQVRKIDQDFFSGED